MGRVLGDSRIERVAFDLTPTQNAHRLRGIGRYVAGLARRLAEQTEVPMEFWGWAEDRPFEPRPPHIAQWLPRARMPRSRVPWLFSKLVTARHLHGSQARVVHLTDPRGLLLARQRQVFTTVYDLIPMINPHTTDSWLERRFYRHYRGQLRKVDGIFAISAQTANYVASMLDIPTGRITLAVPGIDVGPATEISTRPGQAYFLYIGSPEPHKNVRVLIEAMAQASELPEDLVVAGSWYPPHLRWLYELSQHFPGLPNRIHYRGFVPDAELPGLIANATALIVPSMHEGFGLPVAEGLAGNGVVIHSAIPVLEEVSAGAALTFDPTSPEQLAAHMRSVSRDPAMRARLRGLGRERVRAITWDAAIAGTLVTYRKALARAD